MRQRQGIVLEEGCFLQGLVPSFPCWALVTDPTIRYIAQ